MPILEGAYWISSQKYKKYLKGEVDGTVHGVVPGPRGIEILDSIPLRARIWLVEKATDGRSFRFRNYVTGFALDLEDQASSNESSVIATPGNTESQLWDVKFSKVVTNGLTFQIKNAATSVVLDQIETNDNSFMTVSTKGGSQSDQVWLLEPVLVPELYQLTNSATDVILCAPDRPNPSDGVSGEVMLLRKKHVPSTRSQLWTFDYTSTGECFIRSALSHRFALDIISDLRSVIVHKHHGGTSQCWVISDKDASKHIIHLASAKTGTILASGEYPLFGTQKAYTLVTALQGNIDWQIQTSSQPSLYWVTIQNSSGAFLAQDNKRYVVFTRGALHSNDHSIQWRFIMIGNDFRYVVVNRATGFVLGCEYTPGVTSTFYVTANDEDRDNINNQWSLDTSGENCIAIIHAGSKKVLQQQGSDPYTCCCASYRPGSYDNSSSWIIAPFYDSVPSFALVNAYTGRCLAYNPLPGGGTISTIDEINDIRSQWFFYDPKNRLDRIPHYVLSSKMSGNVLEQFMTTRVEAHDCYNATPLQTWRITPLYGDPVVLCNAHTGHFLSDTNECRSTKEFSPQDNPIPCWYLVSHREFGFDFISLDFDILKMLLTYFPTYQLSRLRNLVKTYHTSYECMTKGNDKSRYIPCSSRATRAINGTARVVLAHLIGQWAEDSISQTRKPGCIVSVARGNIEKQWGVCLSQRAFRRCSNELEWIRIDLQGIYDVCGSWKANIVGQWLNTPMFQTIIPADTYINPAVVRRAMLQSLEQGVAVDVRPTPSELAIPAGENTHPGVVQVSTPYRPGIGGGEEIMNSLSRMMGSIDIRPLKHNLL